MKDGHLQFELIERAVESSVDIPISQHAEEHLRECENCRNKLEELAADSKWWDKASDYLKQDQLDDDVAAITCELDLAQADSSEDSIEQLTHSSVLDPASHPEMLGRIGHYDIEQVIGRGGMGVVYKGYDSQLNRAVAIKVLSPHLASNATARRRFAREARAAAAVVHPNVIPIHGVNSENKLPYIVMPLVSGKSLQEHVDQQGPLEIKDIIRIGLQIAAGLEAAHKQGLVHRDIKPANILIEEDVSRVMITDFGLARAADDAAMTQTGWLAGTPHYMSPEQSKGRTVNQSSDLFSLGSVMYFMATGRVPFRGSGPMAVLNMICTEPVTPVRQVNNEIPRQLGDVIEKLLEKQPVDRFKSAGQLYNILEEYLAYLQHPDSTKAPRRVMTRRAARRQSWMLFASAMALLMAAGMIGLSQTEPGQSISNKSNVTSRYAVRAGLAPLTRMEPIDQLMPDSEFQRQINALEHDLNNFDWSPSASFDALLPAARSAHPERSPPSQGSSLNQESREAPENFNPNN